jgi:hypothetical protein
MRTFARQLLVAFLVAWLPFCCCQVRAAAVAVAHAGHASGAAAATKAVPACCRDDAGDDADACCAPDAPVGDTAPVKTDCCTSCKERVLPPAAPALDVDTVGTIDFVATAVLAVPEPVLPASACRAPGLRADTGPPAPPGARLALALHSVLVI